MKLLAVLLLAGAITQSSITSDFVPPTEQEVAIIASGLIRLAEERDLARDERDAARADLVRLQRQMRLFCMRMNDL